MPKNVALNSLLRSMPSRARDELLSFLAFSERETATSPGRAKEELMVSLSFFNATTLRPN